MTPQKELTPESTQDYPKKPTEQGAAPALKSGTSPAPAVGPAPAILCGVEPAAVPVSELPGVGTSEDEDERKRLFESYRNELWKRELSNAENFDRAILAYSSAGLAFSLGFLKDFIPISKAVIPWALYSSWVLFTLAVAATMVSYVLSQFGIKRQIAFAEAYYLNRKEDAFHLRNSYAVWTTRTNFASGTFFIAAIILTTLFVSINLTGASVMPDSKRGFANDGAPIPAMQKPNATQERSAPVPAMQKVPQPQQQKPAPTNKQKSS